MIRDWNRENLQGQVFHFKASLRPFTTIVTEDNFYFLNLENYNAYNLYELDSEGLQFYRKENDEDFMGVDVMGRLEWRVG